MMIAILMRNINNQFYMYGTHVAQPGSQWRGRRGKIITLSIFTPLQRFQQLLKRVKSRPAASSRSFASLKTAPVDSRNGIQLTQLKKTDSKLDFMASALRTIL